MCDSHNKSCQFISGVILLGSTSLYIKQSIRHGRMRRETFWNVRNYNLKPQNDTIVRVENVEIRTLAMHYKYMLA